MGSSTLFCEPEASQNTTGPGSLSSEKTNQEAWLEVISEKLTRWGCNTDDLEKDGITPPTSETLHLAIEVAHRLCSKKAPDRVVLDVNGGIVFELLKKNSSEVFHIWDDGEVEYQYFKEGKLVQRHRNLEYK